jgi:uncharacterized protein (DUF1778 family)
MTSATKDARLNLRLTPRDDELISEAAASTGQTVSEFLTEAAVDRAHDVLADRRHLVVDDDTWDQFLEALDRPPTPSAKLVELFSRPSRIAR